MDKIKAEDFSDAPESNDEAEATPITEVTGGSEMLGGSEAFHLSLSWRGARPSELDVKNAVFAVLRRLQGQDD